VQLVLAEQSHDLAGWHEFPLSQSHCWFP
jgi:hypothetical protein